MSDEATELFQTITHEANLKYEDKTLLQLFSTHITDSFAPADLVVFR